VQAGDEVTDDYQVQKAKAEKARAAIRAWVDTFLREPVARAVGGWNWPLIGLSALGAVGVLGALWLIAPIFGHIYAAAWHPAFGAAQADILNKLGLLIAGFAGFVFVVWRLLILQQQNQIADRQREIAQEKLYVELLTKAVEQLGATREKKTTNKSSNKADGKTETISETEPNIEVRLGGIYALEKLARDCLPLHWQIMEILCAYIKENAGPPRTLGEEIEELIRKPKDNLTSKEHERFEILSREIPSPRADLQAALTVIGRRNHAQRYYENENARSPETVLDLSGIHIPKMNFDYLDFSGTDFSSSTMSFTTFKLSNLHKARFLYARLEHTLLDQAYLHRANISCARLENASLCATILYNATIQDTHFEGALLYSAKFNGASCSGAQFSGAEMIGAHLEYCWLNRSEFEEARIDEVKFDGAWLGNVDLRTALGVETKQIAAAWGTATTLLAAGIERPANDRWICRDDVDGSHSKQWFASPRSIVPPPPPDIHPSSTPR